MTISLVPFSSPAAHWPNSCPDSDVEKSTKLAGSSDLVAVEAPCGLSLVRVGQRSCHRIGQSVDTLGRLDGFQYLGRRGKCRLGLPRAPCGAAGGCDVEQALRTTAAAAIIPAEDRNAEVTILVMSTPSAQ